MANKRIADLDAITSLLSTDVMHAQSGTLDKKITAGNLSTAFRTILTKDANYTLLDGDLNPVVLLTTGAAKKTITLPTAADNAGKVVRLIKADIGVGAAGLDGEGAETVNGFPEIELIQQGNWIDVFCDGSNWLRIGGTNRVKILDPATGWFATKTAGWTADSFSGGLEVDFSTLVPLGTKVVRCSVNQGATKSIVYHRKSGDTNISNTPDASSEFSHGILGAVDNRTLVTIWLSSDYKTQFAVTSIDTDLYIAHPIAIYYE